MDEARASSARREGDAPPQEQEWGYRPHLDGLRAVAVYLVVAFHAGIEPLGGGFIGVDVFFVLSGYLVTQVLLRDFRSRGSVDLRRFYGRRVRRLLPAAAVTLLVTAVVYSVVASPAAVADARDAMRACAVYVANWFFIARSADYFGADVSSNPVLHFWSLAVEEQFYVVWPLLLTGLVALSRRAGRHRWAVVRGVIAAAGIASAVAAVVIATTDLDRAYYGTDTRAYQLLAGALLALSPAVIPAVRRLPAATRVLPVAAVGGLLALPALSLSRVTVGPVTRGLLTTAVVIVLLTSLEASRNGVAARVLSTAPLVYLGRISYGTYLWHWPVIVVLGEVISLASRPVFLITTLLATGVASLSYQLLELPIRRWPVLDRRSVPVVAVGLLASVAIGFLVVPRLLPDGSSSSPVAAATGDRAAVGGIDIDSVDWRGAEFDFIKYWECADPAPASCTIVDGAGPRVLLMGDSAANALVPMLEGVAETRDLQLTAAVRPVCPWQPGLQFRAGERSRECETLKPEWYRDVVTQVDPDVVILANRPITDPANPASLRDDDRGGFERGATGIAEAIEERSRAAVDEMVADGRRVVLMEPLPTPRIEADPLPCLAEADDVAECRFVATTGPIPEERIYRELARSDPMVWSADMDGLACPYQPICDPVIDSLIVRRDPIHLTVSYAASLAEPFGAFLEDSRILG